MWTPNMPPFQADPSGWCYAETYLGFGIMQHRAFISYFVPWHSLRSEAIPTRNEIVPLNDGVYIQLIGTDPGDLEDFRLLLMARSNPQAYNITTFNPDRQGLVGVFIWYPHHLRAAFVTTSKVVWIEDATRNQALIQFLTDKGFLSDASH